jgi:lipopolysaccharide/colanic/teichoic acid biosynthesis glycosyltransferase
MTGRNSVYARAIKPILDRGCAVAALVVFWPLILGLALLVRLKLGSPVLFRQSRPGLSGRVFSLCKFRTMTDSRGANGELLPDEVRLTRFGQWLRSTSLDELPELWNIARGEMSFVGPRPLLVSYLDHYSPEQMRRHDVRPGLTGWAQVNGRNQTTWDDRLRLDVWYVDHVSFRLDVAVMLRTIAAVLGRKGVSAEGHATMPRFDQLPEASRRAA